MNKLLSSLLILVPFIACNSYAVEEADPALAEIVNFRQYSPTFASSGQPSREQFATIAENGFERIVYIAFTNNQNALAEITGQFSSDDLLGRIFESFCIGK